MRLDIERNRLNLVGLGGTNGISIIIWGAFDLVLQGHLGGMSLIGGPAHWS